MHTLKPSTQRGQALVLIVLAAVGLFAFAALAIDGSAIFSDRRHSQNASDTAAYAAALARVRAPTGPWKQAGIDRAIANGYDASDGVTEVVVYLCSEWPTALENTTGATCQGLPAGAKPEDYVYVRTRSVVNLTFARVIGWQQVTNYTDAVVRAIIPEQSEWFYGMALVSAMTGCPAPGEFGPFEVGGNGTTIVNNSGVFVNSGCSTAFVDNGNSNVVTTDPSAGVCVIGGVQPGVTGVNPPPDDYCPEDQIKIDDFWMPDSEPPRPNLLEDYCSPSRPGRIDDLGGGDYEAWPGYFDTSPQTFPDESPAGVLKLHRGVYCLQNGMVLTGNWTITSDLDGDGHDSDTEGVFFYVQGGDVKFNGGSNINLHAIDSTAGGFPSQLMKYLVYIPPSNHAEIEITGNNGSTFTGMILAPTSSIDLIGNGNAFELHTQIIGYNTRISGSGTIDITYDPDDNPPALKQGSLSPTK